MEIAHIVAATRGITTWIIFVIAAMAWFVITTKRDIDKSFYRIGPHSNLSLLGFTIDTETKYALVIAYCIANSAIRTVQQEVLSPWLINHVRDSDRCKSSDVRKYAYEITTVNTLYQWVDWLLYMNILLSQIDMVVIETLTNLIATNFTTYLYLRRKTGYVAIDPCERSHTQS